MHPGTGPGLPTYRLGQRGGTPTHTMTTAQMPNHSHGLAVRDDDPVVFFQHKRLFTWTGPVTEEEYLIPLGQGKVKRQGKDLTILTYSRMTYECLEAARELTKKGFDPEQVARFSEADVARLLGDPGIVRNRLKIESAIRNARGVLDFQQSHGSLDAFLWRYVEGEPIQNAWRTPADLPARTDQSDRMSRDLKRLGFNFVGSTICYAFMQAVGMVNDHVVDCFRHAEIRCLPW